MRISNQKNITINQSTIANAEFKKYISLPFQPDQMNVKLINYAQALATTEVFLLHCPTINETLGSFMNGHPNNPNLSFNAKNFPNNTEWNFRILMVSNGLISDQTGNLSFQLEFLQFADK